MKRLTAKIVILGDDDLECNQNKLTLTDIKLSNTNFKPEDFKDIDIVIYEGYRGTKILKSTVSKSGMVK